MQRISFAENRMITTVIATIDGDQPARIAYGSDLLSVVRSVTFIVQV
jgi:hypothetical protein